MPYPLKDVTVTYNYGEDRTEGNNEFRNFRDQDFFTWRHFDGSKWEWDDYYDHFRPNYKRRLGDSQMYVKDENQNSQKRIKKEPGLVKAEPKTNGAINTIARFDNFCIKSNPDPPHTD